MGAQVSRNVFVTGATGYLGRPLVERLLARGHVVRTLVRPGSESRLPYGAIPVLGDALRAETFAGAVRRADTLVHLVGTPRPSPAKAAEFWAVDLPSVRASVKAARASGVRHLIYVSVAHPAPVMRAYIAVRREGERLVRESGLRTTILRPWYVLGPGHRWPYVLLPLYAVLGRLPWTREGARRLGLVTLEQILRALVGRRRSRPRAFGRSTCHRSKRTSAGEPCVKERGGRARGPATPRSCSDATSAPRRD